MDYFGNGINYHRVNAQTQLHNNVYDFQHNLAFDSSLVLSGTNG